MAVNINHSTNVIQVGGSTADFPALKRVATGLEVRLADDSGPAPIVASSFTGSGAGLTDLPQSSSGYATVLKFN